MLRGWSSSRGTAAAPSCMYVSCIPRVFSMPPFVHLVRGRVCALLGSFHSVPSAGDDFSGCVSIDRYCVCVCFCGHIDPALSSPLTGGEFLVAPEPRPSSRLQIPHKAICKCNIATRQHTAIVISLPPFTPNSFWNFLVWNNLPLLAPVAPP